MTIDYDDHHRHSHYLILNAGLAGFTPRELVLVALIARYHRKGEPDCSELGDLAGADPQAAIWSARRNADLLASALSRPVEVSDQRVA
jgi:exopolyphosphatase/pppGpp-phosphohydrolase